MEGQQVRPSRGGGVGSDLVHIVQGWFAIGLLADLTVHTVNELSTALTGEATAIPFIGLTDVVFRPGICDWFWASPTCNVIRYCVLLGILTYVIFKLVCGAEWVREEVRWRECWEEITWNPWSWFKTLVCVVKSAIKWVLKWICRWIGYIVVVEVIVCIVAGLIAIA